MTVTGCDQFQWDELLQRIKRKNVVPVIGQEIIYLVLYPFTFVRNVRPFGT